MSNDRPVVRSEESVAVERWGDDVRGHLGFRTLFGEAEGDGATASICAGVGYLRPDEWLGSHRHSATEMYFVLDGSGVVTLDGVEHEVDAGHAILIPGGVEHGLRTRGRRAAALLLHLRRRHLRRRPLPLPDDRLLTRLAASPEPGSPPWRPGRQAAER